LRAFIQARDLLLSDDLDASVLRFLFKGASHLAILGESPLPSQGEAKLRAVIEQGSAAIELPAEAAKHLRARRQQFKATGFDYLERRTTEGAGGGA